MGKGLRGSRKGKKRVGKSENPSADGPRLQGFDPSRDARVAVYAERHDRIVERKGRNSTDSLFKNGD